MLISVDVLLGDVVVTLQPTEGPRQVPTGAKYVWRLDPDEAEKVGRGLLKASTICEEDRNASAKSPQVPPQQAGNIYQIKPDH